jgi:hypothetical protein
MNLNLTPYKERLFAALDHIGAPRTSWTGGRYGLKLAVCLLCAAEGGMIDVWVADQTVQVEKSGPRSSGMDKTAKETGQTGVIYIGL